MSRDVNIGEAQEVSCGDFGYFQAIEFRRFHFSQHPLHGTPHVLPSLPTPYHGLNVRSHEKEAPRRSADLSIQGIAIRALNHFPAMPIRFGFYSQGFRHERARLHHNSSRFNRAFHRASLPIQDAGSSASADPAWSKTSLIVVSAAVLSSSVGGWTGIKPWQ